MARSKKNPDWNLSLKETAAVAAVGVGLAWAANKLLDEPLSTPVLATGSALYTIGVVVGSNRPASGWQLPG